MDNTILRARSWLGGTVAVLVLLVAGGACGDTDLLDVEDPTVLTPDDLTGPQAVPTRVNGIVGDFHEAFDDFVRYTSLFTDEMILGGTFPTRIDVDERNVQQDPDNGTLTVDLYEPLHVSRASADDGVEDFTEALDDPEFADVQGALREGIALGKLYGGYIRVFFSELYCQSILGGPDGEPAPLGPDERMEEALAFLQDAEARAGDAGRQDIATAARVGQARALLWLGRYGEAADVVSTVPDDFVFFSEYSSNDTEQWNEIFGQTNGAGPFALRWTVGDGRAGNRHNERWPYLDEWVDQELLEIDPEGLSAAEIGVPVVLQLLYTQPGHDIVLASGWEARMIEAENLLRQGQNQEAEDLVNRLLTTPSLNPMTAVNSGLELGPFEEVDFTGDVLGETPTLEENLEQLARARSAGLWLSGERQATLRRYRTNDGVDLYPTGTQGDDISFPIVQQEIDNNPNVSSGCGG